MRQRLDRHPPTSRRCSLAGQLPALLLALAVLAPAPPADAAPAPLGQQALAQISVLVSEKLERTPSERKVASALLVEHKKRQGDPRFLAMPQLRTSSGVRPDGGVTLDLDATVGEGLVARVEQLGGRILGAHPRFDALRIDLPLERVVELAAHQDVRSIRPADVMITQVTTEGDVAHGADVVRADLGIDGTGVAACALSDSVDQLANLQASGELPGTVTVLAGQSGNPGTSEGTALLEIIHDMAPGADLFFATGRGGQAQMAQNILDLAAAGCDVIVDDVLYFAEPVFQDGVIAQAVDTVAAGGTLYFSSAGNSGNLNAGTSGVFEGDYSGTTLPTPLIGAGLSAHDFGGSSATTLVADTPFFITLQWSDPQDAADNDYDLFLLDNAMANVIGFSTNAQDGTQDPFEFLDSTATDDTGTKIVVVKFDGEDRHLHLNTHRGQIEHGTDGQIFGHPAALGALAVAAVNVATAGGGVFTGGPANPVEAFSSDGPRRIFFESDGTPVSLEGGGAVQVLGGQASVVRQKPDIAAADGVTTTTPGFNPFFGTSASAPHSAGIGALFDDLFPSMPVADAYDAFRSSALDIEDPGSDRDSGSGILNTEPPLGQPIFVDGFESGNVSSWTDSVP